MDVSGLRPGTRSPTRKPIQYDDDEDAAVQQPTGPTLRPPRDAHAGNGYGHQAERRGREPSLDARFGDLSVNQGGVGGVTQGRPRIIQQRAPVASDRPDDDFDGDVELDSVGPLQRTLTSRSNRDTVFDPKRGTAMYAGFDSIIDEYYTEGGDIKGIRIPAPSQLERREVSRSPQRGIPQNSSRTSLPSTNVAETPQLQPREGRPSSHNSEHASVRSTHSSPRKCGRQFDAPPEAAQSTYSVPSNYSQGGSPPMAVPPARPMMPSGTYMEDSSYDDSGYDSYPQPQQRGPYPPQNRGPPLQQQGPYGPGAQYDDRMRGGPPPGSYGQNQGGPRMLRSRPSNPDMAAQNRGYGGPAPPMPDQRRGPPGGYGPRGPYPPGPGEGRRLPSGARNEAPYHNGPPQGRPMDPRGGYGPPQGMPRPGPGMQRHGPPQGQAGPRGYPQDRMRYMAQQRLPTSQGYDQDGQGGDPYAQGDPYGQAPPPSRQMQQQQQQQYPQPPQQTMSPPPQLKHGQPMPRGQSPQFQRPPQSNTPQPQPTYQQPPQPQAQQQLQQQSEPVRSTTPRSDVRSDDGGANSDMLMAQEETGVVTLAELHALRKEAAKSTDSKVHLTLVKRLIEAASVLPGQDSRADPKAARRTKEDYSREALRTLKQLTAKEQPYPEGLFFLANCYGNGALGLDVDHERAFQLYEQAAKLQHGQSAYRTAVCLEIGAGTRPDVDRAVRFYERAAEYGDAAATYKIGMIQMRGLLGREPDPRAGLRQLQRAAEIADIENPHALHELALLYERGEPTCAVVANEPFAKELFTKAAKLHYAPSQFRLGYAYEYGTLGCVVDPKRSIAWYSRGAERGDPESELALSGWYLTGSDGVLAQNDREAYLWGRRAAEKGLPKAEFAVGYFFESGIGVPADLDEAIKWYKRASTAGQKKAQDRLLQLKKRKPNAVGNISGAGGDGGRGR